MAVAAGMPGTAAVATSLAVLRELGQVTLFWDVHVGGATLAGGYPEPDSAALYGAHRFLDELVGMARTFARRFRPRPATAQPAIPALRCDTLVQDAAFVAPRGSRVRVDRETIRA